MLKILDKKRFLGIGFWGFGIRSMFRRLGAEVVGRILLSHPLRSGKGYLRYRDHQLKNDTVLIIPNLLGCWRLVLLGAYCQKPVTKENPCPSGRFNHRCHFIENLKTYPACRHCDIRKMAELAMLLGCCFYIMTSSIDLLRHIFLPALRNKAFSYFLVMICPYAKELFLFPAFISDMEGHILTFDRGSCKDYRQFLLADKGQKSNRTHLLPSARHRLQGLYKQAKLSSESYRRLIRKECLYVPSCEVDDLMVE